MPTDHRQAKACGCRGVVWLADAAESAPLVSASPASAGSPRAGRPAQISQSSRSRALGAEGARRSVPFRDRRGKKLERLQRYIDAQPKVLC